MELPFSEYTKHKTLHKQYTTTSINSKIRLSSKDNHAVNLISINYKHNDSDFNKGFIRGLSTAIFYMSTYDYALPRRHLVELRSLAKNNNIINNSFR